MVGNQLSVESLGLVGRSCSPLKLAVARDPVVGSVLFERDDLP